MTALATCRATLDELYRTDGKAELVNGRIMTFMPTGHLPAEVAGEIFVSLHRYAKETRRGVAHGDGVGYAVPELTSGRESFSPDASFYDGPLPQNRMRFIERAPTFAVDVRSENDYGEAAEAELVAKRADYFEAGTHVVWDVDPLVRTVTAYRATQPDSPLVFRCGDVAHAEPAVPGWRISVADIFPSTCAASDSDSTS